MVGRHDSGFLSFTPVNAGGVVERCFAIGYLLTDDLDERWTQRFYRFKEGAQAIRTGGPTRSQRAAANAAWAVMRDMTPKVLDFLGLEGRNITFAPALSSWETVASERGPLTIVAKGCAARCGGEFSAGLLGKRAHESLHSTPHNRDERRSIIRDARYHAGRVNTPVVFVVDDFITSGATMAGITCAIKSANSEVSVYGMALGWSYARSRLEGAPNGAIPAEIDQLWITTEGRTT